MSCSFITSGLRAQAMEKKATDLTGGFVDAVPAGTDQSDPSADTNAPTPETVAAADAAAIAAAEAKSKLKQEEEEAEEEADGITPLTAEDIPTIPPPPVCKNLEQLLASLPPLPKLEEVTPEVYNASSKCIIIIYFKIYIIVYVFITSLPFFDFSCIVARERFLLYSH